MIQTSIVQKRLYHINKVDETDYSKVVWERKEKLDKIKLLLTEGCPEDVALQTLDVARSTYYRWKRNYEIFGLAGLENENRRPNNTRKSSWTPQVEQRIYHLRKKFPLWGKSKLAVMYKKEFNQAISESMVGRIITKLLNQNKIMPVRFMYGKKDTKRRIFSGHAQRWKYGMRATKPGELIQVDHMSITLPGFGQIKHFNAICPITKYAVYQAYQEANSKNAADFLEHMKKAFPFPILSIQVDGGSEFMADFEKAAAQSNIPLWVLPPRMPEYNCNVERSNGTAKYEFYSQYNAQPNMHIIRKNLQKFAYFYNRIRPHQGIGLLTPWQFYEEIRIGPSVSYVLN
jgi:transposase